MGSGNGEKKGLAHRIAKWAGISTALAGILTPWLFILDLRDKSDAQESNIDAVVQAHGVKLDELDSIAGKFVPWASNYDQWRTTVDKDADATEKENRLLRDKVIRLEAFIAASNSRFNPNSPPASASFHSRKPPPSERRIEQRILDIEPPSAPVVRDVNKARQYRDARKAKHCKPSDPLCGAESVK
jgi:hypothetical protein